MRRRKLARLALGMTYDFLTDYPLTPVIALEKKVRGKVTITIAEYERWGD